MLFIAWPKKPSTHSLFSGFPKSWLVPLLESLFGLTKHVLNRMCPLLTALDSLSSVSQEWLRHLTCWSPNKPPNIVSVCTHNLSQHSPCTQIDTCPRIRTEDEDGLYENYWPLVDVTLPNEALSHPLFAGISIEGMNFETLSIITTFVDLEGSNAVKTRVRTGHSSNAHSPVRKLAMEDWKLRVSRWPEFLPCIFRGLQSVPWKTCTRALCSFNKCRSTFMFVSKTSLVLPALTQSWASLMKCLGISFASTLKHPLIYLMDTQRAHVMYFFRWSHQSHFLDSSWWCSSFCWWHSNHLQVRP